MDVPNVQIIKYKKKDLRMKNLTLIQKGGRLCKQSKCGGSRGPRMTGGDRGSGYAYNERCLMI